MTIDEFIAIVYAYSYYGSGTQKMDEAISEIMTSVRTNKLDGVNIGFEHLYPSDRTNYAEFFTRFRNELHAEGKIFLTTVVACHTSSSEAASCYDYAKIGAAGDYVHVILYDDYPDTSNSSTWKMCAMSEIRVFHMCCATLCAPCRAKRFFLV